jgi:hypothetical protein
MAKDHARSDHEHINAEQISLPLPADAASRFAERILALAQQNSTVWIIMQTQHDKYGRIDVSDKPAEKPHWAEEDRPARDVEQLAMPTPTNDLERRFFALLELLQERDHRHMRTSRIADILGVEAAQIDTILEAHETSPGSEKPGFVNYGKEHRN